MQGGTRLILQPNKYWILQEFWTAGKDYGEIWKDL